LIFLYIGLPLAVAAVLPLVGKASKRVLPDILANAALAGLLVYAATGARALLAQGPIVQQVRWLGEAVNIRIALDGFSLFMLMAIQLVSLCVGLYSINYMEHYGAKGNYYALYLVMIAGMNGLVLSTDLFGVYIFLEVAAVASYALVAYGLGRDELEGIPTSRGIAIGPIYFLGDAVDLERALARLGETARAVVWLHDVEGYTHAEIGALLGGSASFSKSQLARAHARLRELLEPDAERTICMPAQTSF